MGKQKSFGNEAKHPPRFVEALRQFTEDGDVCGDWAGQQVEGVAVPAAAQFFEEAYCSAVADSWTPRTCRPRTVASSSARAQEPAFLYRPEAATRDMVGKHAG